MSERVTMTAEHARLLEGVVAIARAAAWKLETMYARREVLPRAELDALIDLLGSHEIKGIHGYGTPTRRNEAWEVAKRFVRSTDPEAP